MSQDLHCYEYINRPYEKVRNALLDEAFWFLAPATDAAAERARFLVDTLKVSIAGLEVGKRIEVQVTSVQPHTAAAGRAPDALEIDLTWKAATQEALFPSMKARLLVYALSPHETQLDLHGVYDPPAGALGAVADRVAGHRIARAAVHRFLEELKDRLSAGLA